MHLIDPHQPSLPDKPVNLKEIQRCVAPIAVTCGQWCLKLSTVGTGPTDTGDVRTAAPVSVPKKGRCAGVAWSVNGRGAARRGTDGRSIEFLRCVESAR